METTDNKNEIIPRVSIGMPVYNGETYIRETLDSVLSQTYSDFVLYITDNASTDNTETICREYAEKDSRIVYYRLPENVGAAGNYECCFAQAKSEYFRWQNADDTIESTLIEQCIQILDQDSTIVLAYGKSHIIDSKSVFVRKYDDNLHLMENSRLDRFKNCLGNIDLQNLMYGLIRREELSKTARMGAFFNADINLIVELSLYGKFFEIQEHLFNCRRHEECSSWDMSDVEKLTQFWNPAKQRFHLPTWKNYFEYFRALMRSPSSLNEKRILSLVLLKHAFWQKSLLISEVKEYFNYVIGRSPKTQQIL